MLTSEVTRPKHLVSDLRATLTVEHDGSGSHWKLTSHNTRGRNEKRSLDRFPFLDP